jgi:3,4-dihydroxy 2-butanone 4-phosphate synthase/GTP cyclohydrolase II
MSTPMQADATTRAVDAAIAAIRAGGMAVVVDDPSREGEGDLVMAAEHVTPAAVNVMATHGRGLICVPMLRRRLDALGIPPMVDSGNDPRQTAFHVGVDLDGQSTGISATERAATVRALADPASAAAAIRCPGHVFPLAYRPGGVLSRAGHTEASVDLAVLAGCEPAAMICEIAGPDGEMMRIDELRRFARRHELPLVSVSELIEYRRHDEHLVCREASARLPLGRAEFTVVGYRDLADGREHMAAVLGDIASAEDVLVRVHSECVTGDVLGSRRCDCGSQLESALEAIARAGAGVVVYLRGHEGRGIGLVEKLKAYALQDAGLDTVDANLALGHPVDARDYGAGARILIDLGVSSVRLMTNNPAKHQALERHGLRVTETVPIESPPTVDNVRYLTAKRTRLGHTLELPWSADGAGG